MPKNIVLCSDGTGNRGGQLNGTNVWRLYRAVDQVASVQNITQVAFHEDGVGTESFKPLRIIGGAFGYGITRNLEKMYAFLIQHYTPQDDIFLFGFSRGAYTVRLLAGIVELCGVADRKDYSPSQIAELAHDAVRAYKTETSGWFGLRKRPDARKFKDDHGWKDETGEPLNVCIKCVGVWDTVDALGLPFEELTAAFKWLFPLRFHDNKMSSAVMHGFQALSLDDERRTFHPVLWEDPEPAPKPDPDPPFVQEITQVWFSGVHSNVGGGYGKDELSLVPLNWMMDHADRLGLRFHESVRYEYRRDADPHGTLYDSRSGLAAYYRYCPRDVSEAGQPTALTGGLEKWLNVAAREAAAAREAKNPPRIHASVLDRIDFDHDGYAPTGIPKSYVIDSPNGGREETKAAERLARMENAYDLIWIRRGLYYVFLLGTLGALVAGWVLSFEPVPIDHGLVGTSLSAADAFLPDLLHPVLLGFQKHPCLFVFCGVAYLLVMAFNVLLRIATNDVASTAWHIGFGKTIDPEARKPWINRLAQLCSRCAPALRWLRKSQWLTANGPWINRYVVPWLTLGLVIFAIAVLIASALWFHQFPLDAASLPEAVVVAKCDNKPVEFDTTNPCQATGWFLQRGERYCLTVKPRPKDPTAKSDSSVSQATLPQDPTPPWNDNGHPATPDGLLPVWKTTPMLWIGIPIRRVLAAPWFQLRGEIGKRSGVQIAISSGGEFEAAASGELFLFVNDAAFLYGNNHGLATISIRHIGCEPADCEKRQPKSAALP